MPATAPKTIWYREPLVWMLILIPFTAVVMGVLILVLAIRSNDGLVVDDYYRQGKEINRVLARDRAAAAHALHGVLAFDHAAGRATLRLSAALPYTVPTRIKLKLLHATRAGFDRELTLEHTADQRYTAALPALVPGHWYLQLEADDWRLTGSFSMPGAVEVKVEPPAALS